MPSRNTISGISIEDLDAKLERTMFLARGQIRIAFGFSRKEMDRMVRSGVFVAKYPCGPGTRARFLRSQVLAVARTW